MKITVIYSNQKIRWSPDKKQVSKMCTSFGKLAVKSQKEQNLHCHFLNKHTHTHLVCKE